MNVIEDQLRNKISEFSEANNFIKSKTANHLQNILEPYNYQPFNNNQQPFNNNQLLLNNKTQQLYCNGPPFYNSQPHFNNNHQSFYNPQLYNMQKPYYIHQSQQLHPFQQNNYGPNQTHFPFGYSVPHPISQHPPQQSPHKQEIKDKTQNDQTYYFFKLLVS